MLVAVQLTAFASVAASPVLHCPRYNCFRLGGQGHLEEYPGLGTVQYPGHIFRETVAGANCHSRGTSRGQPFQGALDLSSTESSWTHAVFRVKGIHRSSGSNLHRLYTVMFTVALVRSASSLQINI